MPRMLVRKTVAALVFAVTLSACSTGGERVREDYGFKGTTNTGASFELEIKTGPIDSADDGQTLTDAYGNKSMKLGESNVSGSKAKCANPANHDDVFELDFTVKVTDPGAEVLDLNLMLDVADADGNLLRSGADRSVHIAWLTETRATCQTTSDDTFGKMSVSKDEKYRVKGLIVLPGGVDNYDGYKLSVRTDADEIYDLTGGALPYRGGTGVTVNLVA